MKPYGIVVAAGCLLGAAAMIGVRPNSPPQMTSVSSSSPRAFRSVSKPASGLSILARSCVQFADLGVLVPSVIASTWMNRTPGLGEPAGHQALPAEVGGDLVVDAVQVERCLRLLRRVEDWRRLHLHAERQLVGLDQAFELRSSPPISWSIRLRALNQVELLPLQVRGEVRIAQVADLGFLHRCARVTDARALVTAGRKTLEKSSVLPSSPYSIGLITMNPGRF